MTCLIHFAHCRILLAEPTNEAVNRTVKRLKDKEYPLNQLEVVRGEHAFRTAFRVPGVRYTLITEFNPDENTQLLVGTVQVLARIGLHRDSHVGVMLKPPATVVVWLTQTLTGRHIVHCIFDFSSMRCAPTASWRRWVPWRWTELPATASAEATSIKLLPNGCPRLPSIRMEERRSWTRQWGSLGRSKRTARRCSLSLVGYAFIKFFQLPDSNQQSRSCAQRESSCHDLPDWAHWALLRLAGGTFVLSF